MICEQLDFDQYREALARKEADRWSIIFRIVEKYGYDTIYSEADFFSNVDKDSGHTYNGTPCWEWTGKRTSDYWDPERPGYGVYGGIFAYRFAWTMIAGREYTEGKELHHACEYRPCVNPDHLEMLTHKEHGLAHAKLRKRKAWLKRPIWRFTARTKMIIERPAAPVALSRIYGCETVTIQRPEASKV